MLRQPLILSIPLILASCAWTGDRGVANEFFDSRMQFAAFPDADTCAAALDRPHDRIGAHLAGDTIRLLNWNVQKNSDSNLQTDMTRLAHGADLILLQEATRSLATTTRREGAYHGAFAPGYETSRASTGVMTASKPQPLTRCSFTNTEPWLRSPKATNVTQYALEGRKETLLVVNLHLINFTFGVRDMQRQLDEALHVIERHHGPAIVSGDFNTWSHARRRAVEVALSERQLAPVAFATDLRKRVFGNALDHVYIRGLEVVASTSYGVDSSDHNPMLVTLRIQDQVDPGAKGHADS